MNTTLCDSAVSMHPLTTEDQLNSSYNCSTPPFDGTAGGSTLQLPTFTTAARVRVIITFLLCGASAFCNLAVLWAAHSDGKRKSHVKVLIVNLTVADLLVTFIVMPVDAVWNITVQWLAGDFACRLLMFLKLQAMYSCAFVTVVISLDRQSAILNPLAINEARKRNRVMLTVAWGMSVLLSVPQVRIQTASHSQSKRSLGFRASVFPEYDRYFRGSNSAPTDCQRPCQHILHSCEHVRIIRPLGGHLLPSITLFALHDTASC